MLFNKIPKIVSRETFREQSDETAFFDLGECDYETCPADAAIRRLR
jgi:hypothetical protein